jgi:2-dehydro-3-deoxyphosphogluconate aldolase/(4S)-4-hydroxy-2-oxoglutarate aldolase
MYKHEIIEKIKDLGLVTVIRADSEDKAVDIIEKCIGGGANIVEVTFTVPYAHKIIESLSKRYNGSDVLIGAGTVLDSETARIAMLSGAEFIVSPALNIETIKLCNRYGKLVIPGIMTVTEAITALEYGCQLVKLFPGGVFKPEFIKSLKDPLPTIEIMPTGGVDIGNLRDWITAGAAAVGVGGNLTRGDITENAKAFLREIKGSRQ